MDGCDLKTEHNDLEMKNSQIVVLEKSVGAGDPPLAPKFRSIEVNQRVHPQTHEETNHYFLSPQPLKESMLPLEQKG